MFLILHHLCLQQMIHHLFLLSCFRILLGNCINSFLWSEMWLKVWFLILFISHISLFLFCHLLHYVVLISLLICPFIFALEVFKPFFRFDAVVESIHLLFSEFLETANIFKETLTRLFVHIASNEMVLIAFVHWVIIYGKWTLWTHELGKCSVIVVRDRLTV